MLYILHPRQAVIDNVDKMINCGDPSFGGAMYACSKCGNLRRAIPKDRHKFICSFTKWCNNIAASFGYDPLCCPNCKAAMTLTDLYYNHKRVSLEEMYERTIAKLKCRSA